MTLKEFVKDIQKEMKENPDWADREIEFCTIDGGGLLYLSIYDREDKVCIDVGTEEDDDEWNKTAMDRLKYGMM